MELDEPLSIQRPLRRLQQEDGVAIVVHPADFVTAIAFGYEHIELRGHLDYTLFAQVERERVWGPVLFPSTVKTLKVRLLLHTEPCMVYVHSLVFWLFLFC